MAIFHMTILAEISDKMPSTLGLLLAAAAAAIGTAGLALTGRTVAWIVLAVAALVGGLFASAAAMDAIVAGPMRDAVWSELGWPWVLASVAAPMLPAGSAVCVIVLRGRLTARRGFPVDGGLVAT